MVPNESPILVKGNTMKVIIKTSEIQEMLDASESTVWRFIKKNKSFPDRIAKGCWKRKEVMDWFKSNGYA